MMLAILIPGTLAGLAAAAAVLWTGGGLLLALAAWSCFGTIAALSGAAFLLLRTSARGEAESAAGDRLDPTDLAA